MDILKSVTDGPSAPCSFSRQNRMSEEPAIPRKKKKNFNHTTGGKPRLTGDVHVLNLCVNKNQTSTGSRKKCSIVASTDITNVLYKGSNIQKSFPYTDHYRSPQQCRPASGCAGSKIVTKQSPSANHSHNKMKYPLSVNKVFNGMASHVGTSRSIAAPKSCMPVSKANDRNEISRQAPLVSRLCPLTSDKQHFSSKSQPVNSSGSNRIPIQTPCTNNSAHNFISVPGHLTKTLCRPPSVNSKGDSPSTGHTPRLNTLPGSVSLKPFPNKQKKCMAHGKNISIHNNGHQHLLSKNSVCSKNGVLGNREVGLLLGRPHNNELIKRKPIISSRNKRQRTETCISKPKTVGGVPQPLITKPPMLTRPVSIGYRGNTLPVGLISKDRSSLRRRSSTLPGRPNTNLSQDPYGLDVYDEEDLNFIDDGIPDAPSINNNWKAALRHITGYDPSAFAGKDEGEASEASVIQQLQEERRSASIAAAEDALELKRLQDEKIREKRLRGDKRFLILGKHH